MKNKIKLCFEKLHNLSENISAFGRRGNKIELETAIDSIIKLILDCKKSGNNIFFIGNGGSASIASHMAADFLKNGKFRSLAFNDASLLTCISNDLGYENVFSEQVGRFANKNDILFAISSSGKSASILNSAETARKKGCFLITLSGFSLNNPLLQKGDLNIYVSSKTYSHVEILHLSICHYISDMVIERSRHR